MPPPSPTSSSAGIPASRKASFTHVGTLTDHDHLPNLQTNGRTPTTGGHELSMRIIRRLQHGPRAAVQICLQG